MNDTHGEKGKGWYGFDLDGTLAKYDGWKGIDHIGEPVKPMVELIKRMHDEGKVVKIMTARVAPRQNEDGIVGEQGIVLKNEHGVEQHYVASYFIRKWCETNLGFIPEIVYQKDHLMLELYDDRVKQVVPNEGWLVEDIAASKRVHTTTTITKTELVSAKWHDRLSFFMLGMAVTSILVIITLHIAEMNAKPMPDAVQKLHDAIHEYKQAREANEAHALEEGKE